MVEKWIRSGKLEAQIYPILGCYTIKPEVVAEFIANNPPKECVVCGASLEYNCGVRVTCLGSCCTEYRSHRNGYVNIAAYTERTCPNWCRELFSEVSQGRREINDVLLFVSSAAEVLGETRPMIYYWANRGLLSRVPTDRMNRKGQPKVQFIRREILFLRTCLANR